METALRFLSRSTRGFSLTLLRDGKIRFIVFDGANDPRCKLLCRPSRVSTEPLVFARRIIIEGTCISSVSRYMIMAEICDQTGRHKRTMRVQSKFVLDCEFSMNILARAGIRFSFPGRCVRVAAP